MCEFAARLVSWLDGELPDGEAAKVGQHLRTCGECQERVEKYRKVSGMVSAYCDAALAAKKFSGGAPGWAPVLGAAASLAVLLVVFAHSRAGHTPAPPKAVMVASAPEAAAPAVLPKKTLALANQRPRRPEASVGSRTQNETRSSDWLASELAIEIAIPGEEVFPPGALPAGVGFVADISIAADGSAQRLRLHPQLTGIEEGPNQ